MPKVTMQSTLSVISLGTPANPEMNTSSRVCIEQVAPGRWMAHAVISPVDLGPFTTETDAAQAIVNALDRLAYRVGEAYTESGAAVLDIVEVKATPAPAPVPVASSLVEATTTIASAHTATGPTVPTEVRPVVIEDTGHAPVAPVAVGPLGHPVQ